MKAVHTRSRLILVFILFSAAVFSTTIQLSTENLGLTHPLHEELSFDPSYYNSDWYTSDANADGMVDHAVSLDNEGQKLFEVIDFDKNGLMDDFYFYKDGVLIRQEIDQNGDRRIDLWVYITEGIYIEGYERDSDYDGRIDLVKLYGDN